MSAIHASRHDSEPTPELLDGDSSVWSVFYDMPAWGISLLVHVAIFVVLASLTFVTDFVPEFELTSEIAPEEIRPEEYVLNQEADVIGSESDMNIVGPSMAAAQHVGMESHREEIERLEEELINPAIAEPPSLPTPNESEAVEMIELTGTTEFAGGTEGAVDRITQEIAASLRQRKTLVVWLLDESGSLNDRREQIANRFENIYKQLGLMDVDTKEALKTGIIGYGQNVHVLQKEPSSDLPTLVSAVRGITEDKSGEEKVFTAIAEALKVYLPEKRRMRANMMLILVTDERGDDYHLLEDVVNRCAREDVKAYCIGNTSLFGREKGFVHAKWEVDGQAFEDDIEVDQGPETAAAEGLQIPFWTASARGLDRMSSGYGPYTLSRLCAETGGIFFIADQARGITFDPGVMRQYSPDYRPLKDYQKQLAVNMAKAALVNAAQLAINEKIPVPQLRFQANNDNVLREQITEAQKPGSTGLLSSAGADRFGTG
ncbi:MAG: VWA domain-containing protein [Planctomycetaceae bacterium]